QAAAALGVSSPRFHLKKEPKARAKLKVREESSQCSSHLASAPNVTDRWRRRADRSCHVDRIDGQSKARKQINGSRPMMKRRIKHHKRHS
ncbi:hypothetical protein VIGAN_UM144000, partial [Vigna angularis var. angularis]